MLLIISEKLSLEIYINNCVGTLSRTSPGARFHKALFDLNALNGGFSRTTATHACLTQPVRRWPYLLLNFHLSMLVWITRDSNYTFQC